MAVIARLYDLDSALGLLLRSAESRERIADFPPGWDARWPIRLLWDAEKLDEQEEWEFLGLDVLDISRLDDRQLDALERLGLPRLGVPEEGLTDVAVADVLRWAQR